MHRPLERAQQQHISERRGRPSARAFPVVLLLALLLGGARATLAQTEPTEPSARPQEELAETLIITAGRFEQPLGQVPTHTTVLEETELRNSPAVTVDDALRQVPGFSLFRRNGSVVAHPTTQGVSLRGIGPSGVSRTLVLLDGLPLNDPFGGWVTWGRVAKAELDRVEIVRGGGSSAWGSSALGGVIQLLTHDVDGQRFDAGLELGERGTESLDLAYSNRRGRLGYGIFGAHYDTGGYPVLRADQRGAIDVPARSEHDSLEARLDGKLGDRVDLGLRLEAYDEERGNGTQATANATELLGLRGNLERIFDLGTFSARAFVLDQELSSTFSSQAEDRASEVPALDQFLVDTEATGIAAELVGATGRHLLAGGVEGRATDGFTNEDFFLQGGSLLRRRRAGGEESLGGLWLQDAFSATDRIEIALGARVDRWQAKDALRREHTIADGTILRDDRPADREETEWSPRIGATFEATSRLRIAASLYSAFRAPTLNELYRPFRVRNDITEANAGLEPETLVGGELGLRFTTRELSWGIHLFRSELDEAIGNITVGVGPGAVAPCGFVPAGGVCRQRQNLGEVRVSGLEAELERQLTASWRLGVNYLFDDTEVTAAPRQPELVGNQLAQVPEHQLSVRSDWSGRRLGVTLLGRWVDEQFEDDLNQLALDAVTTVDSSVRYALGERWQLFAAAENLLNEEIEAGRTGDGLVTIGAPRLVRIGVRVRVER